MLPGADDVPAGVLVVGAVFAVVALAGAYGLWNRKRWGYRVTIVITVLNILSSVPGIAEWPSNAIGVAIIITIILGIALLVLMRKPEVRQQVA